MSIIYTNLLKPSLRVLFGNLTNLSDITPMVSSVVVNSSGSQNTSTATVIIDNTDDANSYYINMGRSKVVIYMGYWAIENNASKYIEEVIFTGITTSKKKSDSKNGANTITVECADYSSILRDIEITATYNGMTLIQIIHMIADGVFKDEKILVFNRSGKIPTEVVNYTYSEDGENTLEFDQVSCWDAVVQLTDEWGLNNYFDEFGHWIIDMFEDGTREVFQFTRGENISNFTGTLVTPSSVYSRAHVQAVKEDEQIVEEGFSENSNVIASFTTDAAWAFQQKDLEIINDKVTSPQFAEYMAKVRVFNELSQLQTIELSSQFGVPYIHNADFVRLVGEYPFDGLYWIRSISHEQSKQGYMMSIKADSLPGYIQTGTNFAAKPPGSPTRPPLTPKADYCPGYMAFPAVSGTFDPYTLLTAPDGTQYNTNKFGKRWHPTKLEWLQHDGIDIDADCGTDVVAAWKGTVTKSGWYGDYGNFVEITDGKYKTRYGHLRSIAPGIIVGKEVAAGTKIGTVGTSGNSTSCHLHFELWIDGFARDPAPCLGY